MHVNWCMKNSMSRVLLVFCDEACLTYGVLTVVILYLLPLVLRLCCMVLHIINAVLQPSKKKKLILLAFCNLGHINTLLLPKFCAVMKQVYCIGDSAARLVQLCVTCQLWDCAC